jgi:hypothetical protein
MDTSMVRAAWMNGRIVRLVLALGRGSSTTGRPRSCEGGRKECIAPKGRGAHTGWRSAVHTVCCVCSVSCVVVRSSARLCVPRPFGWRGAVPSVAPRGPFASQAKQSADGHTDTGDGTRSTHHTKDKTEQEGEHTVECSSCCGCALLCAVPCDVFLCTPRRPHVRMRIPCDSARIYGRAPPGAKIGESACRQGRRASVKWNEDASPS